MAGRIELFQIEDVTRHGVRRDGRLRLPRLCAPGTEAFDAFQDKAPGFSPHDRSLDPGLPTALRRRFGEEANRPDDLIIMLEGIDTVLAYLEKLVRLSHVVPPCWRPARGRGRRSPLRVARPPGPGAERYTPQGRTSPRMPRLRHPPAQERAWPLGKRGGGRQGRRDTSAHSAEHQARHDHASAAEAPPRRRYQRR